MIGKVSTFEVKTSYLFSIISICYVICSRITFPYTHACIIQTLPQVCTYVRTSLTVETLCSPPSVSREGPWGYFKTAISWVWTGWGVKTLSSGIQSKRGAFLHFRSGGQDPAGAEFGMTIPMYVCMYVCIHTCYCLRNTCMCRLVPQLWAGDCLLLWTVTVHWGGVIHMHVCTYYQVYIST